MNGIHPPLRDIPERFETKRLVIRCPRAGDGAMVHAGVAERAGLVLEGIMRHERVAPDGTPRETCLCARTR